MAILDIYTENPDISWIIKKNPLTQKESNSPFMRNLRQGVLYGWYKDNNNFRILFKDGKGKSSFYKNLNNNYLDQSAYNCPYTYCAMINEMLSNPIKEQHEKDIECLNAITLSSIQITLPNVAQFFIKYFATKVNIEMSLLAKKVYEVKFSGNISMFYLTNLVQVFCLMQSIEDKNIYIDLTESAVRKYSIALKNINAPYFIIYTFISRAIPDYATFMKVKDILELGNWKLNFGNTQKQRFDEIKKFIHKGMVLQDIGCGELYYTKNFATYYNQVFSWDMESSIQERNAKYITKKGLFNVILKPGFNPSDAIEIKKDQDILISEMLEHMPKEEASEVLKAISVQPFRKLIITLPNGEFNQFYKLDGKFRHDDHYWEPTYQEAIEFIENVFGKNNPRVLFKPIGDGVNNIHVSTLIVISNEN